MVVDFFRRFLIFILFSLSMPTNAMAQDYSKLSDNFKSSELTYDERRYLQTALAFEGHYVGLLDGEWGKMSKQAMLSYSKERFGENTEEWHSAILALDFFEKFENDGWNFRYFPALNLSVILPLKRLNIDAPSDLFLNYSHSGSSLAVSVGVHTEATAEEIHKFTRNFHKLSGKPYSVRKQNFAITTGTNNNGVKIYTRSNFIKGKWSTIMLSAQRKDFHVLSAVASSITVGTAKSLNIPVKGKLHSVIETTLQMAKDFEAGNNIRSNPEPKGNAGGGSSGSGFFVSDQGHLLTNAHVVESCSQILVDGKKAELVDVSGSFDLALLKTASTDKTIAVFSQTPAKLNSDVTAVGFPYAGILGGLNVTRGSVSSLKGLNGDGIMMQITAPIQSGNSGGPVIAASGKIVGVVVSKLDSDYISEKLGDVPQNVNFAIRGEIAKLFLSQNQVEPLMSEKEIVLAPEVLAEKARDFTAFIECQ